MGSLSQDDNISKKYVQPSMSRHRLIISHKSNKMGNKQCLWVAIMVRQTGIHWSLVLKVVCWAIYTYNYATHFNSLLILWAAFTWKLDNFHDIKWHSTYKIQGVKLMIARSPSVTNRSTW